MLFFYIWIACQIVLESLPISSSGHIQLLEAFSSRIFGQSNNFFVGFKRFFARAIPIDTLAHVLHAPTVLIVTCFFYNRWMFLLQHIQRTWRIILKIVFLVGIVDTITALFFIIFKCVYQPEIPLGLGFFITACTLYSTRYCVSLKPKQWSWQYAIVIGVVQGITLLPGISRFASVYAAARWLGLPQTKAFEITWLVQWPLIFVASMHGIYALYTYNMFQLFIQPYTLMVMGGATIMGYYILYWMYVLARTNMLWRLSYYMLVPILGWLLLYCNLLLS
ncbi:MAG TPA: undecaprenyl-diphosphate phosphatase [Candidatus Dependentiae bacterium]|nr:undecaprenyl-diphosphate phosphatase [Candidatus Dependentiae bacterium]HRQ62529.1 undecaprenyl-diphosphate phosphatase [Candidatus Dependentiae bacterium]